MTPRILTITGMRGSGKSTIAKGLVDLLQARGTKAELLDEPEITEGLLRMAVALARNGIWVVMVNPTPGADAREDLRSDAVLKGARVFEVEARCSVAVSQRRGGWEGESAYEAPSAPDCTVDTELLPAGACAEAVLDQLTIAPESDAPILLVGCGGSGTRLLSQMAQALGVFLGTDINDSDDSLEVVDMINWLAQETAKEPAPTGKYVSVIRQTVWEMLRRGKVAPDAPWGWKLPETLYVLPLILEAFPKARVVHLVRHPASVILDRPAHVTANMATPMGQCMLPIAYAEFGRDPLYIASDPHWLQGSISWLHQVKKTASWCREKLASSQYLELKFEDLTGNGPKVSRDLAGFLGLRPIGWRPAVDASRLNVPKPEDPDFRTLWAVCWKTASLLGYEGPPEPPPAPPPVVPAPPTAPDQASGTTT